MKISKQCAVVGLSNFVSKLLFMQPTFVSALQVHKHFDFMTQMIFLVRFPPDSETLVLFLISMPKLLKHVYEYPQMIVCF